MEKNQSSGDTDLGWTTPNVKIFLCHVTFEVYDPAKDSLTH